MEKRSVEYILIAAAAAGSLLLGLGASLQTQADDTEIYQATFDSSAAARPKVLIVFDNSGSMGTEIQVNERPAYDPNLAYPVKFDDTQIYWSKDDNPPTYSVDNGTDVRHFSASANLCGESLAPLAATGRYTTKAQHLTQSNNANRYWGWSGINRNSTPAYVDCQGDVIEENPSNGPLAINGYPVQLSGRMRSSILSDNFSNDINDAWRDFGSDNHIITFYSAHYLNWYYDEGFVPELRSRLEIAQEVINGVINSNTSIDFGLAVFNSNEFELDPNDPTIADPDHGGRIVSRIIENMTAGQRDVLAGSTGLVTQLSADGYTPLCETTYEVYQYLSGEDVLYGDQAGDETPGRDLLAEDPAGTYSAPSSDCAYTYVILMTDGEPTRDIDADEAIKTLTGDSTCYSIDNNTENCLPNLAEYMANNDLDGDPDNGDQFGITYTIGFHTEQALLEETARLGKGEYFTAFSTDELTASFNAAIAGILADDATFTSPAVAVDTFTRTQSRNEVFFAMFKPTDTVNWPGNIKRLDISFTNGVATLVDSNGDAAMDPVTGRISDSASTLWGTGVDGGVVEAGGVGALLAARGPSTRVIQSNTGVAGALEAFNDSNIVAAAYGYDQIDPNNPEALLYNEWDVADQAELAEVISWGQGYDVDNEDDNAGTTGRAWLLDDILHSKPLVVNYGALGTHTETDPDLRIIVGTNGGFLHMFGNDDGEEDWAFFGKELGSVLTRRRENAATGEHVYGIDSPAVLYSRDLDFDGTLNADDGDIAWVYVGLRRGGRIMYALDISDPDSPAFLWQIDATTVGFGELGQTWSVPVITKIPGYVDSDGIPRPVLIFGAGYDPNKDDHDAIADSSDAMGRGLFIVDAETGELVWGVTPYSANSVTNLREDGLVHSVAASVTPLDSNGDELVDRIYFGDTGGNLWRVDMPFNARPTASQDTWRVHKVFAANGGTQATDRRFFNAPDVVRTTYGGTPIDAIVLGSGDRTNPAELDNPDDPNDPAVDNQFYMIRDRQVSPYFTAYDAAACDPNDPAADFRCNLPLDPNDLYSATANLIQVGTDEERLAASTALQDKHGWYLDLGANGEKSLARSLTIAGQIFFTTFSPDAVSINICEPPPGTGRLYNVGLFDASEVRDFDQDGTFERSWIVGSTIPDTPAPHFGPDGEIRLLLPPGSGAAGAAGNPFETGSELPSPYGSFWYREEY